MKKNYVKMVVDITMTVIFILLMDIAATGIFFHELLGLIIAGVFIYHLILNRKWIKGITIRLFDKAIKLKTKVMYWLDVIIAVSMGLTTISGILISQVILKQLASDNTQFWYNIHASSSYISLILISVHIGMHWKDILSVFRRLFSLREESKVRKVILRVIAAVIAVLGLKSSIDKNIVAFIVLPITNTAKTMIPQVCILQVKNIQKRMRMK